MLTSQAAICGWAQQIADHLGVELEVVDMSFDGIIPAVKSGQVDLGIAAFTKTPERAEEIDFSDLYEKSAQLLIVKAGNADLYSTKESLAGQKVGAQKGTIQSQLIQTALPDSELFELEKYPALALEVQNGQHRRPGGGSGCGRIFDCHQQRRSGSLQLRLHL